MPTPLVPLAEILFTQVSQLIHAARQLMADFGKGWGEHQVRYCVRMAEVFADEKILHTLCSELSWSHLRLLIQIDDPLKCDFILKSAESHKTLQAKLYQSIVLCARNCNAIISNKI